MDAPLSIATDDEILGYEAASELINLSPSTMRAKVSRGEVPHFRLSARCVRFSRKTLLAWLAAHAVATH